MQKIVKLNRAFLYCCMVVMFCLHSTGYAAPTQGKPVSITIKNSSLAEVLRQVSKKSGLYIYFQDADLAAHKNVTIDVRNKPVESVLHELLDGRGFSWVEVSENTIAVKKKPDLETRGGEIGEDTVATITVTGKVVDEKGEPVIGATVAVKGSKIGTTTNPNGDFVLGGVRSNGGLVISNISFLTVELALKGRNNLGQISLKKYVGVLDEVQVQAYGTTNRRYGTGNISTVKAFDIEKAPVGNPLLAIAGRVPGIFIQQSSGVPGSGVKITIQGQNSISYGNDPFYVIDGVPYTSQLLPGLGDGILGSSGSPNLNLSSRTGGNPLSFINPQDIESIDILKDADATSIYGSRAANGAIIITTKKGRVGKAQINLNIQQGGGKASRMANLLNTQEYLEMRREAYLNDKISIPTNPAEFNFSNYDLTKYDQNKYTDWQKELLGGIAENTNIQATLSGSNGNIQYILSGGYQRNGTITPADLRDQKASLHFNINGGSDNNRFNFSFSGTYVSDDNRLAAVQDLVSSALTLPPNAPDLYTKDGTLNWELLPNGLSSFLNPLASLNRLYINKTNNLISNLVLSYQVLPGLEIKSSFGYNSLESDEISTAPSSALQPFVRPNVIRQSGFNSAEIKTWIIEPQLIYKRQYGIVKLDFLLGTTIQNEDRDRQNLTASGFISDESMQNIKSASSVIVDSSPDGVILSTYKYNAGFSRANLNIDEKYLLTGSIRRDGSSRFGKENRFHNFYSLAGAWIFSNEACIKDNLDYLSFGKIRFSYGTTGNDQIGDYAYLNLYGNTQTLGTTYQGIVGLQPFSNFPNPYLQWEQTKKISSTIDLGFFKDRLLLNATYYRNTSSNQLSSLTLPSITGGNSVTQNRPIIVRNTGWEMGVNTINIASREFNWTSSLNLTIPKNKLIKYDDLDAISKQDLVGRPLGITKVYRFIGVDTQTGLYLVADKEGKPTSNPNPDLDKTVYVDLNPSFYGGFQNSFRFKEFTLDVLFQFVKQRALSSPFGNYPGGFPFNQLKSVLDRWQKVGDNASIQKYNTDFSAYNQYVTATQSDRVYSNASYARLKNLSLSYQIPTVVVNKIGLQNARVYLQGQNILTFTKYNGVDPETQTFNGVPTLKMIVIGIQVGL